MQEPNAFQGQQNCANHPDLLRTLPESRISCRNDHRTKPPHPRRHPDQGGEPGGRPKLAGMPLYEPLHRRGAGPSTQLPRRSAKETFFPALRGHPVLSRRKGRRSSVKDIDPSRFPRDGAGRRAPLRRRPPSRSWTRSSPGTTRTSSTWSGAGKPPSSAWPAPAPTMPVSAPRSGSSPAETKGSDLFLTPLEGGGYACEASPTKGKRSSTAHQELFAEPAAAKPLPLAAPRTEDST